MSKMFFLQQESIRYSKKLKAWNFLKFWDYESFWLWENLNFSVWTYSIISCFYNKCNKRNLPLIKAMLCRIQNYFLFMEHNSSCFELSVIDSGTVHKLYQKGHKPSMDACQPLSTESGYSMIFSVHCLQINVCKSARFRCLSVPWVTGINRELFWCFWFS